MLWQVRGTNPKNFYDVFQDMILFNGAFSWDLTCAVRRHDLRHSAQPMSFFYLERTSLDLGRPLRCISGQLASHVL